jgi:preprotein translocase subunit SecD
VRRSVLRNLIIFVVVVLGSVAGVLAAGWRPLLGLDLQGGVAVVLKPTTAADTDQINQAISIIRSRVDAIGVAEPDITRQGSTIVVQLPGVKDQQRALDLVGTTAELRFRPVLQEVYTPAALDALRNTPTSAPPATAPPESTTTAPGAATSAPATTTTAAASTSTTEAVTSGSEQGLVLEGAGNGEYALGRQTTPTTAAPETTTTAPATTSTAAPADATATTAADGSTTTAPPDTTATTAPGDLSSLAPPITSREDDKAENTVVLPEFDSKDKSLETHRYQLGPALVTGDALAEARAALRQDNGAWYVALKFKDGDDNVGRWRAAASACLSANATCPTGRLAIVLDGKVLSTPQVQSDFRDTNDATITGAFTEKETRTLATALKYGALPVEFERQQSQEVSPTIGRDALKAGIASGIIGLALVGIYILIYYRVLGIVALLSLALSFGLLWAIISWLGATQGLALSLAGVTGIIVSIGVSIDSNIVYFEQIKDDMATGRNLRSSAERAFRGAMSTIIKADAVSLIGAMLLYFLTVGPVRGFALYLGISTVLDLIASYFFMRPAVVWLSRTRLAAERPKTFGIPEAKPVGASAQVTG